jgi:transglutaminase-like putative cysteine protease
MTTRRWRLTILSALSTLAAAYPVTTLFMATTWLSQAAVVVGLVAVLGLVLRGLTRSRVTVIGTQLVVVAWVVLWRFAGDSFTWFLPTTRTGDVVMQLAGQAYETIQRYTAPAPLDAGVTFCLVTVVSLLAICVDALAATLRAPAAAGLPLLTAYLITASNGSEPLGIGYFVLPVALWLAMLHTTAQTDFRTWGTTASVGREPGRFDELFDTYAHTRLAGRSFSGAAVRLGLLGIALALVVPTAVPHLPPRYLAEGLGRGGVGAGAGTVGFNDTIDLTRSLKSTDQTPVLRYTTDGTRPPLRVLATGYYARGEWRVGGDEQPSRRPAPPPPRTDDRRDYTMTVTQNALRAPRIAAPYPVVAVSMEGTPWRQDPTTGDILVGQSVASYRVTYANITPRAGQLQAVGAPEGANVSPEDLALPETDRKSILEWSDEVSAGEPTELDKAIAIQNHLRDTSTYTYTLDLGEPLRDARGRVLDPITTFRLTKRGYCTQFATAMIMLARAQGIPARMAIGFLPGQPDGDGGYVVRASDAHAWPELYFDGYGWLRFEPTPGSRSGNPPAYAVQTSGNGPTGSQASPEELGPSRAPSATPSRPGELRVEPGVADGSVQGGLGALLTPRGLVVLAVVLVALLGIFIMPLTAGWVLRRRRRRAVTQQDLVEVDWDELTSHLQDLGLTPPEGGSLRTWREHYIHDGHLDDANAAAMRRITATLERARYDRPERTTAQQTTELRRDIRTVRRQIGRSRAWHTRLRALLWPETGVSAWRGLGRQERAERSRRRAAVPVTGRESKGEAGKQPDRR